MKKYDIKSFRKDTYRRLRLVGREDCAKYSTEFFDSAYPLTWSFVQTALKERGAAHVTQVVERNAGKKNPPFITAEEHRVRVERGDTVKYRRLDIPGLEGWSMCIHYGQYAWLNDVLSRRILDLDLSLEDFSLEYVPGQAAPDSDGDAWTERPDETDQRKGAAKPGTPDGEETRGKQVLAANGYSFTLYGERYEHLTLKKMMLTVFKKTLDRHPDKLGELVNSLACLGWGNLLEAENVSSVFRAGETCTVGGTMITIGTSLGRKAVLSYIGRLMKSCGEPKANLAIDGCED